MYIYCVLINTLSAHIMRINLNIMFYTHVEHSPIKNKLGQFAFYRQQTEGGKRKQRKKEKEEKATLSFCHLSFALTDSLLVIW